MISNINIQKLNRTHDPWSEPDGGGVRQRWAGLHEVQPRLQARQLQATGAETGGRYQETKQAKSW